MLSLSAQKIAFHKCRTCAIWWRRLCCLQVFFHINWVVCSVIATVSPEVGKGGSMGSKTTVSVSEPCCVVILLDFHFKSDRLDRKIRKEHYYACLAPHLISRLTLVCHDQTTHTHTLSGVLWNVQFVELTPVTGSTCLRALTCSWTHTCFCVSLRG